MSPPNRQGRLSLSNSNEYVFANKVLKTQRFSDLQKQKLLGDTILILKARNNGAEKELLDLGELFKAFHHFGGRLLWKIINGKLDFVFRIVTCMHK